MFTLFQRKKTTSLLAREIKINENPTSGDYYIYVEGDEIGFMNWLLKTLGLKDPSVSLSISDKYVTRVNGKKDFSVIPTSEIHNFNAGFAKNKGLILRAIAAIFAGLFFLVTSISARESGMGFGLLVVCILIAFVFLYLYSRSGGLSIGVTTFNNNGEQMMIKSGLTGTKLEKNDFEKSFNAVKNAVSEKSKYFNK